MSMYSHPRHTKAQRRIFTKRKPCIVCLFLLWFFVFFTLLGLVKWLAF